jgi:RimJ/RimL family protein N-acetyltransferase
LIQGDDVFSAEFGVPVESGWVGFPEALPFLVQTARGPGPPEWGPHLFFDEDDALVGNGGWKGPPVDRVAELGYAVAPGRQGRGIATAVIGELVERARAQGLRVAVAHTLAAESPSTRVLQGCGFEKASEFVDSKDGPVWRWERVL